MSQPVERFFARLKEAQWVGIFSRGLLLIGTLYLAPVSVRADPIRTAIPGVFSTGENVSGGIDRAYTITSSPNGSASAYVTSTSGFPFDGQSYSWVANTGSSQWISPQSSYPNMGSDPAGYYTYETTFSLAGFDPSTAVIVLNVAADNDLTISLNNNLEPFSIAGSDLSNQHTMHAFTLSSGFLPGTNTLDFTVYNIPQDSGNPSGLQVQIVSATAIDPPIPEPGTLLVFGTGVLALSAFARRRFMLT
jgi:hypothetical protein